MNRKLKRLGIASAMLVLMVAVSGCGNQPVGVIDGSKVSEAPKVQQLQKDLQAQLDEKAKELSTQLEQEKANLSPEQYQARYKELREQFNGVQDSYRDQIYNTVNQAVAEVSKQKNLSAVLYKESVAQGGVDITDEVVQKLQ